jgi:hypothetical protein
MARARALLPFHRMQRLSWFLWVAFAFAVTARAEIAVEVIGPPACSGSGTIVAIAADDVRVQPHGRAHLRARRAHASSRDIGEYQGMFGNPYLRSVALVAAAYSFLIAGTEPPVLT